MYKHGGLWAKDVKAAASSEHAAPPEVGSGGRRGDPLNPIRAGGSAKNNNLSVF